MEYRVPMTPEMRKAANEEIDRRIRELQTCAETTWKRMYLNAYEVQRALINALPDGYPTPVRDRTR